MTAIRCLQPFWIFCTDVRNDGITSLNENNVFPLLTLADKYGVLYLKDLCCKFIETVVEGDIEHAFAWLSLAEQLATARHCH